MNDAKSQLVDDALQALKEAVKHYADHIVWEATYLLMTEIEGKEFYLEALKDPRLIEGRQSFNDTFVCRLLDGYRTDKCQHPSVGEVQHVHCPHCSICYRAGQFSIGEACTRLDPL